MSSPEGPEWVRKYLQQTPSRSLEKIVRVAQEILEERSMAAEVARLDGFPDMTGKGAP